MSDYSMKGFDMSSGLRDALFLGSTNVNLPPGLNVACMNRSSSLFCSALSPISSFNAYLWVEYFYVCLLNSSYTDVLQFFISLLINSLFSTRSYTFLFVKFWLYISFIVWFSFISCTLSLRWFTFWAWSIPTPSSSLWIRISSYLRLCWFS